MARFPGVRPAYTTPIPDAGDTIDDSGSAAGDDATGNWESRYLGLQKVVAKRDEALNTRQAELDALRAEHEAANAELATFRQTAVDANEDEQARASYEALRERFEPERPKPVGNNPPRGNDWTAGNEARYAEREREGTSQGFPTS